MRSADIHSQDHGTIISLAPGSVRGQRWLSDWVAQGGTVYTEPRYGVEIIRGALRAGLKVRDLASGRLASVPA